MESSSVHGLLKTVSHVVLLLMLLAIGYGAYISMSHWSGIGV